MERNCAASCNLCPNSVASEARTDDCKDKSQHCQRWSEGGKCKTRSDYMNATCPASCALCETLAELKENKHVTCRDTSQYCMIWKMNNMCELKAKYMTSSCRESCGFCSRKDVIIGSSSSNNGYRTGGLSSNSCEDTNIFCPTWMKYGLCGRNEVFMNESCPKSCDLCKNLKDEHPIEGISHNSSCKDSSRNCYQWAESGYCSKHAKYMNTYCKASCNKCLTLGEQRVSNGCVDRHNQCPRWALEGRCYSRPDFMMQNCNASCSSNCSNTNEQYSAQTTVGMTTKSQLTGYTRYQETSDVCTDIHKFCSLWKGAGYCQTKERHMKYYCSSSCSFCSTNQITIRTTSATTYRPSTTPQPQTSNTINCKREENIAICSTWIQAGYCERYERYMSLYCSRSCGFCGPYSSRITQSQTLSTQGLVSQQPVTAKGDKDCTDRHSYCNTWVKQGRCAIRPRFMLNVCKKSCKFC